MVAPADADCGDPGIVCHLHIECCVAYYVRIRRLDPGVGQRALDHFGMRLAAASVGCLQGDEAMPEIMALQRRPQTPQVIAGGDAEQDRKSTRLNSSNYCSQRQPSSA